LDEEDLSTDARPGEARGDARFFGALCDLAGVARRAEELDDARFVLELTRREITFGDLHRDAADAARDLTLESTNTRFTRVVVDDRVDRGVLDVEHLLRDAVLLDLL